MRRFVDEMMRDVAYGWRGLRQAPGFAAAALATLALGVAANTAIVSVARALLVQPLPFRTCVIDRPSKRCATRCRQEFGVRLALGLRRRSRGQLVAPRATRRRCTMGSRGALGHGACSRRSPAVAPHLPLVRFGSSSPR
jgi:hypothetical protein